LKMSMPVIPQSLLKLKHIPVFSSDLEHKKTDFENGGFGQFLKSDTSPSHNVQNNIAKLKDTFLNNGLKAGESDENNLNNQKNKKTP